MTALEPQLVPSTQFIEVAVTYKAGGVIADPTGIFDGFLSFKPSQDAEPGDDFTAVEWVPAAWANTPKPTLVVPIGAKYGGITLGRGLWHVFVGLDDGVTEAPIFYAGTYRIK